MSLARTDAALVGLWRFEDDFTDSSGTGNNGTQKNSVVFVTGQPGFGKAASFNGSNRVEVPHHASLNMTSVMTISAWINADGNQFEGILAKNPSAGSGTNQAGNYELRLNNAASPQMQFLYQRGGVNDTATLTSSGTVAKTSWQHIAVTMDGTNVRFYLNGALQSTNAATSGFGATNTNLLYLGTRADLFTGFNGQMDDIAIFNEVLNATAINTIRTGDFSAYVVPEPGTGLLALLGLGGLAAIRRRR